MYVGIELDPLSTTPAFCIYVHDGYSGIDYTIQTLGNDYSVNLDASIQAINQAFDKNLRKLEECIIIWLQEYSEKHHCKILTAGIGVSLGVENLCRSGGDVFLCHRINVSGKLKLLSKLWFDCDILPIIVETKGSTIDERACSAIRKALNCIITGQFAVTKPLVGFRHRVEVDLDGRAHFADLENYESVTDGQHFDLLLKYSESSREKGLKIAFFNSTPQGGGVATMRHSIIRILRLLKVNVQWYVARPKPDVFDITKKRMHNVLQGVAPPGIDLTNADQEIYEDWCKSNVERDWALGPFKEARIIVIDDPQLAGTIPWIKKYNPEIKIIFRMHIQIDIEKLKDIRSNTHHVWKYLWSFIQDSDAIVFHPNESCVPKEVPQEKLFFMPASYDPLDGLNKKLSPLQIDYYQRAFNRIAQDMVNKRLDFKTRPIIAQFCRFDPSKGNILINKVGIHDVILAYYRLRQLTDPIFPYSRVPQLLICGFGSIDDPEGHYIFEETLSLLENEDFQTFDRDIVVVRIPPSDQLLNALLRSTTICLQLSTREGTISYYLNAGFEIKVTEALSKGIPVVAYRTGGIVHQVIDGKTGYLVENGDYNQVASLLQGLLTDQDLYRQMSHAASKMVEPELLTPYQAISWLWLFNYITRTTESVENNQISTKVSKYVSKCWIKNVDPL